MDRVQETLELDSWRLHVDLEREHPLARGWVDGMATGIGGGEGLVHRLLRGLLRLAFPLRAELVGRGDGVDEARFALPGLWPWLVRWLLASASAEGPPFRWTRERTLHVGRRREPPDVRFTTAPAGAALASVGHVKGGLGFETHIRAVADGRLDVLVDLTCPDAAVAEQAAPELDAEVSRIAATLGEDVSVDGVAASQDRFVTAIYAVDARQGWAAVVKDATVRQLRQVRQLADASREDA